MKNLLHLAQLLGHVVERICNARAPSLAIRVADTTALVIKSALCLMGQEIASSIAPDSGVARCE